MATVWRLAAKQGRLLSSSNKSIKYHQTARCISTSKKHKDITGAIEPMPKSSIDLRETEEYKKLKKHFADADPKKEKNWITYGFDDEDRDHDVFTQKVTMFLTISLVLCWGSFVIAYLPDVKMMNWSTREAYLELSRREAAGLPKIDKEFIPLNEMLLQLPSEEELGDDEIFI